MEIIAHRRLNSVVLPPLPGAPHCHGTATSTATATATSTATTATGRAGRRLSTKFGNKGWEEDRHAHEKAQH